LRYKLKSKEQRQLTSVKTRRLDIVSIDYSDIPQLCDEFFAEAEEAWPPMKEQLTIRLDADVLTWLKVNGRGYQTRINRILRTAMESQTSRGSGSTAAAPKEEHPATQQDQISLR
jgi:uncharacterized protein (DUF4415 family)